MLHSSGLQVHVPARQSSHGGSCAVTQIHKGTLSARGAARTKFPPGSVVAVKVRHPGVSVIMERDFALMQRAALLSKQLPLLSQLNLEVRLV